MEQRAAIKFCVKLSGLPTAWLNSLNQKLTKLDAPDEILSRQRPVKNRNISAEVDTFSATPCFHRCSDYRFENTSTCNRDPGNVFAVIKLLAAYRPPLASK
jgi:hypothetical protein